MAKQFADRVGADARLGDAGEVLRETAAELLVRGRWKIRRGVPSLPRRRAALSDGIGGRVGARVHPAWSSTGDLALQGCEVGKLADGIAVNGDKTCYDHQDS